MLRYCKLFEETVVRRKEILNREILPRNFQKIGKTEPRILYTAQRIRIKTA